MESVNKLEIIYELVMICIFKQVLRMLQLFINGTMIGVRASEKFSEDSPSQPQECYYTMCLGLSHGY